MKTIGLVVAIKQEISPFFSACQLLGVEKKDNFTFYQLEKNGDEWVVALSGIGKKNAQAAAMALVKHYQPHALISAGFAGYTGILSPENSLVYLPKAIMDIGENYRTRNLYEVSQLWWEDMLKIDLPVQGTLLSMDRIIRLSSEKRELGARYPGALIDMETSGVAAVARLMRLPFLSVRIVSDDAKKDLRIDFQRYLGENYHLQYSHLLTDMALNPVMAFNFLRFLIRNRILAGKLSDFLENLPGSRPEEF
jgi:nucleoside phosphorylase